MREKLLAGGVDVNAPLSLFAAERLGLDLDVLVAVKLDASEVLVADFSGDVVTGLLKGATGCDSEAGECCKNRFHFTSGRVSNLQGLSA